MMQRRSETYKGTAAETALLILKSKNTKNINGREKKIYNPIGIQLLK